jgi:hypothetical protein
MMTNLATAALAHGPGPGWGPHMYGGAHPGGPGWWLIFPIAFILFLFGALGVAYLWVIRRTRPQPPQGPQPPSDATPTTTA